MNEPNFDPLLAKLDALLERMDKKRKRDIWDIFPVLTTFLGTVVLGAVGLYVSQSFERFEADRSAEFRQAQIDLQRAQSRIEELKAITALAPMLASSDTGSQRVARQLLQAVQATGGSPGENPPLGSGLDHNAQTSHASTALINTLAGIVLSSSQPDVERVRAAERIAEIALAETATDSVRGEALQAATLIATAPGVPSDARRIASDLIENIKNISADEAVAEIQDSAVQRKIIEVIIHHVGPPTRPYRGAQTVIGLAEFQAVNLTWSRVSWHYAIAPDGTVWTGMPLDERAYHAGPRNAQSVSVLLLLNGDTEIPPDAAQQALGKIVRALQQRLSLFGEDAVQLHRDVDRTKTCPGRLITREFVNEQLREAM